MLHVNNETVRALLFQGNFGLERETLRITEKGFLAQTPHPFSNDSHIVRDFSENQIEINTGVQPSPAQVLVELAHYDQIVQKTLSQQNPKELLWPFSNPPYLCDDNDIPVAQFHGEQAHKTRYREYLASHYGRYKMMFSGIHVNFSFSDELLQCNFEVAKPLFDTNTTFTEYKNTLYLNVAQRCVACGWMLSAVTAASPIMDSSFVEQGNTGTTLYSGLGSVRCSELGYWNYFTPVLDYSSPAAYADSIQQYVNNGSLMYPSELYYPVRLKPHGVYNVDALRQGDISHIELRMFDLNPTDPLGCKEEDIFFAQLLLIWLASTPMPPCSFDRAQQIQAVQNFKNAAHYDLRTANIVLPQELTEECAEHEAKVPIYCTVNHAAIMVLDAMTAFYRDIQAEATVFECLEFQRQKFTDAVHKRYTHRVRCAYETAFVEKGLALAQQRQQEALLRSDTF